MPEDRRRILEWIHGKIITGQGIPASDMSYYREIEKIFELAPDNLTYTLKKLLYELQNNGVVDHEPFAPIYVEGEGALLNVIGFRVASLDGGGQGPDEIAVVLETE
jgi:hypothetical protein